MVNQVRSDAWQVVVDDGYPQGLQVLSRADAGDLQNVRRIDGAARHDHFSVGADFALVSVVLKGGAHAPFALEHELARLGLSAK